MSKVQHASITVNNAYDLVDYLRHMGFAGNAKELRKTADAVARANGFKSAAYIKERVTLDLTYTSKFELVSDSTKRGRKLLGRDDYGKGAQRPKGGTKMGTLGRHAFASETGESSSQGAGSAAFLETGSAGGAFIEGQGRGSQTGGAFQESDSGTGGAFIEGQTRGGDDGGGPAFNESGGVGGAFLG